MQCVEINPADSMRVSLRGTLGDPIMRGAVESAVRKAAQQGFDSTGYLQRGRIDCQVLSCGCGGVVASPVVQAACGRIDMDVRARTVLL
jgi:hypothetical protein